MKHVTTLASLLSLAYAAPTASPRDARSGIAAQCINSEIRESWLVSECLTDANATTRIQSAVYLPNKIMNDDGNLVWKDEGHYTQSCSDCKLINNGASLNCQCRPNYGQRKNTTLNFDEHISVYSGHLLSNLKGAPQVPTTPSPYPVPADLSFGFGGNATCPTSPDYDWCQSVAHTCTTSSSPTDTTDVSFRVYGPLTCYVPVLYMPYHFQFEVLKLVGEGAWEMAAYPDEACAGEPLGTIGTEEMGVCKSFSPFVRAVTVRPVFNGDPN